MRCIALWWLTLALGIAAIQSDAKAQNAESAISKLPNEVYLKDVTKVPTGTSVRATVKPLDALTSVTDKSLGTPKTALQYDALARGFISNNAASLGLDDNAASLVLKGVRTSLTGTSVEYEQQLNGIPIVESRLGISVDPQGAISSVTRNVYSVPAAKSATVSKVTRISEAEALDLVTADLKPAGKTIEPPSITKAYLNENNVLTLVYIIRVAVQQPFGYWEYRVDSQTGRIVEKFDRRIQEGKRIIPGFEEAVTALPRIDLNQVLSEAIPVAK